MSRAIRLKEYAPNATSKYYPPDWYINQVNKSFVRDEFVINTDRNGFIKPHAASEDRETNIVVLGDSVVEGMYMDENLRMCAVLDRIVNRLSDVDLRVLNGGYSGSTLLHIFNLLLNKIVPLRPTAIIVMTGIVDVDAVERKASFWTNDKWLEPIISLDCDNSTRDNIFTDDLHFRDRYAILALFKWVAAEFGLTIWFATIPHHQLYLGDWITSNLSEEDFRKVVSRRRAINNTTRTFCIKNDIRLFDLELLLSDRDDIFYDFFHFNQLGGEAAAQAFMEGGLLGAFNDLIRK